MPPWFELSGSNFQKQQQWHLQQDQVLGTVVTETPGAVLASMAA